MIGAAANQIPPPHVWKLFTVKN